MQFRLTAAIVSLLSWCCLDSMPAWSHDARRIDTFIPAPKVDAHGFVDVWQLRRDAAAVEARYADGSAHAETNVCEHEDGSAGDLSDKRAQRRRDRARNTCIENARGRFADYQNVFATFNRAWLPVIRDAIARGDTVAEVIMRQCGTTRAIDRSGIESTCDEEPRKAVAIKRLREIGFIPALDIEFPSWQRSPDQRKTQLDNQLRALDAIRHGALGFDTMEVQTGGNTAKDADELQAYRNYAVIEAALQDAPRAFTVTPGTFHAGWKTSAFAALRLDRQPLTPGFLTWGRSVYFAGNPSIYSGPRYWRSSPTRVFVPHGESMQEIAVSGTAEPQFQRELADTLAAAEASIDGYLRQDPRWGVFLLHRVGLHEWVPQGTRSTTQMLDPAWAGHWRLEAQTLDWEHSVRPTTGSAVIRRNGALMQMSVSTADAPEPFSDVDHCTLRYSGGVTYLPDASAQDETHTALGYIDAAASRQALAPLNRRQRYKQVLMECKGAEWSDSDRVRFLLLARDRMVEIGVAAIENGSRVSVRHYRRIK